MIYASQQESVGIEEMDESAKVVKVWGDEIDCLEMATLIEVDDDENMLVLQFKTTEAAAEFEGYMKRQQAIALAGATNASA